MARVELSQYDNSWYKTGASFPARVMWYIVNAAFFNSWFPFQFVKRFWLRAFGSKLGRDVVIKPGVNIKYPWNLSIGDHVWIGEKVWLDSLAPIRIGSNCCLSQGAYLLTGNHDYTKSTFDLQVREIVLEEGVWIGAMAIVCPGVTAASHAVLTAGSVATKNMESFAIYQGNPAERIKDRIIGL